MYKVHLAAQHREFGLVPVICEMHKQGTHYYYEYKDDGEASVRVWFFVHTDPKVPKVIW
jgi:hypothetical protein